MTGRRRRLLVSLSMLLIAASAAEAWGFWTSAGVGSSAVRSGTLVAATISTPTSAVNSITVTWAQQATLLPSSTANTAITYSVERRLGSGSYAPVSSGGCSGTKAYAITSCLDVPDATGIYSYRIVATFATWTATSSRSGEVSFLLDTAAPTVQSIVRSAASPTNATSVSWTVTLSETVTGVDSSDFTLATSGPTGTSLSTVTGSGATYTVTASTGSGDGTLGLNLADDDTITDTAANPLGDTGTGNGNLTGQTYTIDKTAPTAPTAISVLSGVLWSSPPTCAGVASGTRYINGTATSASATATTMTATVSSEPGLTIVFSATSSATAVTSPPLAATTSPVTTTRDLSSLPDGLVTLTAYAVDAAGNTSATGTSTAPLRKDTIIPTLTATYRTGVLSSKHIDGASECAATITAVKLTSPNAGHLFTDTAASDGSYDIDPVDGPPLFGDVSYSVTAKDRAGNVSAAVITGS